MNQMPGGQPPVAKRTSVGGRRLLGDARRETLEAVHIAAQKASKRRRLAGAVPEEDEPGDAGLGDDDGGVFADAVYEQDDVEADEIYAAVDRRMESRRKKQRENRLQDELQKYRDANPTIRQQFSNLKSGLADVSVDQWASIPDIGDYSVKKQKQTRFAPAPDSLLESARQETATLASEPTMNGAATDLAAIGAGRSSVLGQKLDRASDSVSGQTNIDPTGYLTEMAGVHISSDSEIGDIKKARLLLKSVTSTNPNHAPGWIAAARLEEVAGKMSTAQKLILEGCRKCPKEEDVWIEAARLYPRQMARRVLAQAVKSVPKSVKIWLQAATLEDDVKSKRRVLLKSLEIIPRSERLWKAAVELEEPSGAKILLSRAVECVPGSTSLWLALARLETYENAKEVLSRAREAVPAEPCIWVTAAKLEESHVGGESPQIAALLRKGVDSLSITSSIVKREKWIEEMIEANEGGFPSTVQAIVEAAIGLGVDERDRESIWLQDAESLEGKGCKEGARAVYAHLTRTLNKKWELWRLYAEFERRCQERGRLQQVLEEAVENCEQEEVLWLMLAKDKWKFAGADAAREVLQRAFKSNPDSEAIWLAAAKVETENNEFEHARALLQKARSQAPSSQVYMKSALLERQLGRAAEERTLLEHGLEKYPSAEKLWLMLAQWHERYTACGKDMMQETNESRSYPLGLQNAGAVYAMAVEKCKTCVFVWIGYARFEEQSGLKAKARAILERGRQNCKGRKERDILWRESVYLEVRDGKREAGRFVLVRALQDCKTSGRLWSLAIALESRADQKAKCADALKHCPDNSHVILEAGKFMWRIGKNDRARTWLKRAVQLDQDVGDSWATLLAFEKENGDDSAISEVVKRAIVAEPRHGDMWTQVSKAIGNESLTVEKTLHLVATLVNKNTNVSGVY